MTTQMQRPQPQAQATNGQAPGKSILDQTIDATMANWQKASYPERFRALDTQLARMVNQLEGLLPPIMRGQGERLVKRAMLTFSRVPKLQGCTPTSIIRCVLGAAEVGLAIDGRLAHAVPYSNKVKQPDGREQWQDEAQLIVDYKGLIAVARRCKIIEDAYARVVYEKDQFRAWFEDGKDRLFHEITLDEYPGKPIGCYAVVVLPDSRTRFEFVPTAEINKVRQRSKSYASSKGPSGPWVTDYGEMMKKTVLRRVLKTYMDDPAIIRLMELDDDDDHADAEAAPRPAPPTGRVSLRQPPAEVPPPEAYEPDLAEGEVPNEPAEREVGIEDEPPTVKIDAIELEDLNRRLREAIDAAASRDDLGDVQADLTRNRDVLGKAAYEQLAWACKTKAELLAKPAGKSNAKSKDF